MGLRNRLGDLQQAILDRDPVTILAEIDKRAIHTDDGCKIWPRTSPDGMISLGAGRGETYTHRVALWARLGCPSPLNELGTVHHRCSRRACVNSGSCLVLATSLLNTIESQARRDLVARIRRLEGVVRGFDPEHEALEYPKLEGGDIHWLRRGPQTATPARLAEQARRRAARQATLAAHAEDRFSQVRAVRALIAAGMARAEALEQADISRAAFDRWSARLDRIENGDSSGGQR